MNVHVHHVVRRRVGLAVPTAVPRPSRTLRILLTALLATAAVMTVLARISLWVG